MVAALWANNEQGQLGLVGMGLVDFGLAAPNHLPARPAAVCWAFPSHPWPNHQQPICCWAWSRTTCWVMPKSRPTSCCNCSLPSCMGCPPCSLTRAQRPAIFAGPCIGSQPSVLGCILFLPNAIFWHFKQF